MKQTKNSRCDTMPRELKQYNTHKEDADGCPIGKLFHWGEEVLISAHAERVLRANATCVVRVVRLDVEVVVDGAKHIGHHEGEKKCEREGGIEPQVRGPVPVPARCEQPGTTVAMGGTSSGSTGHCSGHDGDRQQVELPTSRFGHVLVRGAGGGGGGNAEL